MAIDATTVEERLAALEQAVAELQKQRADQSTNIPWWERIAGSFKDEPAFDEVLAHGRAFRNADRPAENDQP